MGLSRHTSMALLASAIMGIGCMPISETEGKGSTSSKLLAPRAQISAVASDEATEQYGIVRWKLYRGRRGVFLTGLDGHGKPVHCIATTFAAGKDSETNLVTMINDGGDYVATVLDVMASAHGWDDARRRAERASLDAFYATHRLSG